METQTGTIVAWNRGRGFGFVSVDGDPDGDQAFVHAEDLGLAPGEAPAVGQRVTFRVVDVGKGPRCTEVELVEEPRRR